jgi:acetyl esterase/lipase
MPSRLVPVLWAILVGASGLQAAAGEADAVIPIWPDGAPDWAALDQAERDTSGPDGRSVAGKPVIRLGFVSTPELHVYEAKSKATDTAILISPGGGYSILAWDLEGTEIAQWLQSLGVTAVVVKYRVPTNQRDAKWLPPVQDIQRAISLARTGGIPGVKAQRIGVLGFSAGGNASARVALATKRFYEPMDEHDQAKFQPDFAVLVYPAWLIRDDNPHELIEGLQVTSNSPPMFLAHAQDDRVDCMSSVTLFAKLKEAKVPSALHVFSSGGHGYGAREAGSPTDAWPSLCESWMKSQGWLTR